MTTLTYTDLTMRTRSRSRGLVRVAFDRLLEARDRQVRRHALSASILGPDRLDLSDIERRSLFETNGPERR